MATWLRAKWLTGKWRNGYMAELLMAKWLMTELHGYMAEWLIARWLRAKGKVTEAFLYTPEAKGLGGFASVTCGPHVSGKENVPLTCKSHVKHHFFACGMH